MVMLKQNGEISINTASLVILAKSIRPLPIVKEKDGEKFDAFDDKEQRYFNEDSSYRESWNKEIFILRAKIIKRI